MEKQSEIGFLETIENGKRVRSWTRLAASIMLIVTVFYVIFSVVSYYLTIGNLLVLAAENPEFKPTAITLIQMLNVVDLPLFLFLLLSWIAPKAIAKIAENKLK